MVGLMDIAPSNRVVKTSFGEIKVVGLSLNAIVGVIKRHPELLELFQKDAKNLGMEAIADLGLDVVASVLAAGLGYAGDPAAEQRCKDLNPEDAIDIGQAILDESFPNGTKSFFDKVAKVMARESQKVPPSDTINSLNK